MSELFILPVLFEGFVMAGQVTHYSASGIEDRILGAIRTAGLDPDQRLSPTQLAALDHFHTGGFRASLALRELAQVRAEDRVLDIGAGLAGPARMLAASPGCRVDCIELSDDFCVAATLLNSITGLEDRIRVHQGSALDMPFADAAFDVAWMQNVGMNIADKRRLYREIHRVLKPNGRFAFQEMVAGNNGVASYFPLPWALDPADNLLVSSETMRTLLAESGFTADYFEDVSDAPLPTPATGTPESAPQAPLSLSAYVDNLGQKAENATRSVREGQIRLFRGVFRAN
jgi:sarcosine/dimethylglycine N-methyltransferase